jgi:hypothetical protein
MINLNGTLIETIEDLEIAIASLSEQEKTRLRNDFNGVENDQLDSTRKYYKIFDYMTKKSTYDTSVPPENVNFITGLTIKLHRKSYLVKGECIKEEYYESCVNGVYSNLIVSEHSEYIRDPLGFPTYRTTYLKYYDQNDAPSENIKTWQKFYSQLEKIQEGKIRRGNLVENLQMPCIGLISIALSGSPNPTNEILLEGRRFLYEYKKDFDAFVDESNKEILQCLTNTEHPRYISSSNFTWIDSMTTYGVTIRQYLTGELTL